MRLNGQTKLDCFFGNQSRSYHDRWVAGVGATGNRGDDNRSMPDLGTVSVVFDGSSAGQSRLVQRESTLGDRSLQRATPGFFHRRQRHSILRPLGARQRRLDGAQIEPNRLGVLKRRRSVRSKQSLLLGV